MKAVYHRMFEDPTCSIEEAKLKATILGKTYEQCKQEWKIEVKKEFILNNIGFLRSYNFMAGSDGKFRFEFTLGYVDSGLIDKLITCGNVIIDRQNNISQMEFGFSLQVTPSDTHITIEFYECELESSFMNEVNNKLEEYRDRNFI